VVGDDVSGSREHGGPGDVAAFGGCANDFHFGSIGREQAVGKCDQSEQNDNGNSTQDDATGPRGRFSTAIAHGMIDAQTLEIVVFGVRGHCNQSDVTNNWPMQNRIPQTSQRKVQRLKARSPRATMACLKAMP
jgi:hypothetical protein